MARPTPLDYAKTLRAAARSLEQHHARVRDTKLEPGLGAQLQLGPLLRSTFSLAETLMDELTAMSTSTAFTSTTGSRQSLNRLASALASVTDAAAELGFALGENAHPGKAQGDIPDPAGGTVWKALCDQARPRMGEHLHNAAHQLELASISCHYIAWLCTREWGSRLSTTSRVASRVVRMINVDEFGRHLQPSGRCPCQHPAASHEPATWFWSEPGLGGSAGEGDCEGFEAVSAQDVGHDQDHGLGGAGCGDVAEVLDPFGLPAQVAE